MLRGCTESLSKERNLESKSVVTFESELSEIIASADSIVSYILAPIEPDRSEDVLRNILSGNASTGEFIDEADSGRSRDTVETDSEDGGLENIRRRNAPIP